MRLSLRIKKPVGFGGRLSGSVSYGYAGTRTRAMASRLLIESDYEKFLKMDTNEIIRFLEEGEYKAEIDAIGAKAARIQYFEKILNENFANAINKLISFAPKKSPVKAYLIKYDIMNIKTLLRGIETKRPRAELERNLIQTGTFSREFLKKLSEKTSKEGVIKQLENTEYCEVLEGKKNLEGFEDALDRFYFEKMLGVAKKHKNLLNLIKLEIDAKNILLLLRLKNAKIKNMGVFFVKGGNLSIKKLIEFSFLDSYEIIKLFKDKIWWRYTPTGTKELDKIEAGLKKYVMLRGVDLLRSYVPSFDTLLGYIIAKEREIDNIRVVLRSKLSKNPEDALNIRSKLFVKK